MDSTMDNVIGQHKNEQDVANNANLMIMWAMDKHIGKINTDTCKAGDEDAFFVADLGEVYRQYLRWQKKLPRVTPHYAVKCNPDPEVLSLLKKLGVGFDCASKAEIEQVLALGVEPWRIIYAQPCKTKSYLRYTAEVGVYKMTFDNADELYKIKALYPDAELLLRILADDSTSACQLSQKFGADMETFPDLLYLAKQLELNVVGVAFHVGSGATNPNVFYKPLSQAQRVFIRARNMGFKMHTLDCGGGFVPETFDHMAFALSEALDEFFPARDDLRIIAEPGRYFTANAFTLACNVIARRTVKGKGFGEDNSYMLYLNDGVYGNFSSIIFDHQQPIPKVLRQYQGSEDLRVNDSGYNSCSEDYRDYVGRKQISYSVWGPTCDGIDRIAEKWSSPKLINTGDWLYFENMGAYTKCSATRFNGFTNEHKTIYVCSDTYAASLMRMAEFIYT